MFMFGVEYMDVATISHASKYSSGSAYYFPNYTAPGSKCLSHLLAIESVVFHVVSQCKDPGLTSR